MNNNSLDSKLQSVKKLLDKKVLAFNNHGFIENDPIQVPHKYSLKQDIEIAAFLTATISWGQRKNIIKSAYQLMQLLDDSPYDFVVNAKRSDLARLNHFVYRTFQPPDCVFFIQSLQNIYNNKNGLETIVAEGYNRTQSVYDALLFFREQFLSIVYPERSIKHIPNVLANSSAKRLNMFLRWMVRQDDQGIDFGIWRKIPMSALMLPLDLHTGNVSRLLGILKRKQNDWKAVEEVMEVLRMFDSFDPVKYDFALFGMGVNNDIEFSV